MFQSSKYQCLQTIIVATFFFSIPMQVSAQSEADCAARADRASRAGPGVVGSAAAGALGGAAFGAIVGDSSKATRRGAALGGVVGGVQKGHRNNQTYKRVYDDCMAGR